MGTLIKVGGVWKDAATHVKVGGVWKAAAPYVKVSGVWKPLGQRLWVPTDAGSDLIAWFDFTDAPPNTGGVLTHTGVIANKKGSGPTLTIENGNSALSYANSGVSIANGDGGFVRFTTDLPSVYFDMAFVGTANGPGSWRTLVVRDGGSFHHVILQDGGTALGTYTNGFFTTGLAWAGGALKQLYFTFRADTDVQMALDGGTLSAATGEDYSGGGPTLVRPALMNYTGGGQGFGNHNEFVFMVAGQTTNLVKAQGYLAHKWDAELGVTTLVDNLPSGHAHKSSPPMV